MRTPFYGAPRQLVGVVLMCSFLFCFCLLLLLLFWGEGKEMSMCMYACVACRHIYVYDPNFGTMDFRSKCVCVWGGGGEQVINCGAIIFRSGRH